MHAKLVVGCVGTYHARCRHGYERKARDYRHAYKWPGTKAFWAVEKLRKVCRTHRCTMDQDIKFIMEELRQGGGAG